MGDKFSKGNNVLLSFHCGCRSVIFGALGIREMENSGIFITGWYLGGFFLAYSIGMIRRDMDVHSLFTFFLSLILIILLSISGLSRGHLKNRFGKGEKKNGK